MVAMQVEDSKPIHSFSFVLYKIQIGAILTRKGWNGTGMWIALQVPDSKYKYLPCICLHTSAGHLVPWVPSQTDILAVDWYEV